MMRSAASRSRIMWALFAVVAMGVACNGANGTKSLNDGKERSTHMENLYPVLFAGPERSSFIHASSNSRGEVAWEKPLNDKARAPFNPVGVLVSERQLFVYSDSHLISFNPDGSRLWERNMRPGSMVGLAGDTIYFRMVDALDRLAAVTTAGQTIDRNHIILESDLTCRPIYILPLEKSFLAVSLCVGPPEGQPPAFIPYRKEYEKESFLWSDNLTGTPPLAPLYVSALDRMIVFAPEEIVVYNAAKTDWLADIISRFPYPFEKIIQASVDSAGVMYMMGIAEGRTNLVAVSSQGEELWRWIGALPTSSQAVQPPVIGVEGLIHVPSGRILLTIKDGAVVREFPIEKKSIDFCAALADGSILITADDELFRVDRAGELLYGLAFEHSLLTPPVVDRDGNVYVATAGAIMRIE